jgi:hypothetical protein
MRVIDFHRWNATLLTAFIAVAAQAAEREPNIVHIVADDLGSPRTEVIYNVEPFRGRDAEAH